MGIKFPLTANNKGGIMRCVLISSTGVAFDQVNLSNVAVGDSIQTKRGLGTVEKIDFGRSFTYVTVNFD